MLQRVLSVKKWFYGVLVLFEHFLYVSGCLDMFKAVLKCLRSVLWCLRVFEGVVNVFKGVLQRDCNLKRFSLRFKVSRSV